MSLCLFLCITQQAQNGLAKTRFYIRVHLLDTSVGSIHIQAVFGESDVTIFLRKQEETLFGEFSGHLYGTRQ